MASPDMDVIKEIPGYKVILKAILKSQIQQLVEQLACHTEEESIILTASVSDGTLSHLGSDSGKSFLEDHEDVKSQFLGFCLKFHHKKKQEKERKEQEEKEMALLAQQQQQQQQQQQRQFSPRGPSFPGGMPFSPRFPSPRHQMPMRSPPGARHEPYPISRPIRRTSLNFGARGRGGPPGSMRLPVGNRIDNQVIKIEAEDPDESSNQSGGDSSSRPEGGDTAAASSSQPSSPSSQLTPAQIKAESSEKDDDAKSNSSSSTIPNEASELKTSDGSGAPQEGLSFDSDLSALASEQSSAKGSGEDSEGPANVKLEAISESEMELEITGVEPGRNPVPTSSQEGWSPGMQYGAGGATGSPGDMQQGAAGYNVGSGDQSTLEQLSDSVVKPHRCQICGRGFQFKCRLTIHMRTHTGVRPYQCRYCQKQFAQSSNLNTHMRMHAFKKVYGIDS